MVLESQMRQKGLLRNQAAYAKTGGGLNGLQAFVWGASYCTTLIPRRNSEVSKVMIRGVRTAIAEEELAAIRKRTRKVLLDKMKRPMVLGKGLCLALRLPNSKHRRIAIRWHLGTFPIHYRFLRRIGLQRLLDHMEYLAKKKLEPPEQILLRIALDTISRIPEVPPFVRTTAETTNNYGTRSPEEIGRNNTRLYSTANHAELYEASRSKDLGQSQAIFGACNIHSDPSL